MPHLADPLVKIELSNNSHASIQVELTQERYRELKIEKGDELFVTPKSAAVFVSDYAI